MYFGFAKKHFLVVGEAARGVAVTGTGLAVRALDDAVAVDMAPVGEDGGARVAVARNRLAVRAFNDAVAVNRGLALLGSC